MLVPIGCLNQIRTLNYFFSANKRGITINIRRCRTNKGKICYTRRRTFDAHELNISHS